MRHVWLSGFKFRLSTILSNIVGLYWRGAFFFFWLNLFFFWAEMWLKQLIFFIHPRATEKEWQRRTRSICLRFEIRILWRCQGGRREARVPGGEEGEGSDTDRGQKVLQCLSAERASKAANVNHWTNLEVQHNVTITECASQTVLQCLNTAKSEKERLPLF